MPLNNFGVDIADRFFRCGQPNDPYAWAAVKGLHVTDIIKLNAEVPNEQQLAGPGIVVWQYLLPLRAPTVAELKLVAAKANEILTALNPDGTPAKKVLLGHCEEGVDRVGYLVAARRLIYDKAPWASVEAEMLAYHMNFQLDAIAVTNLKIIAANPVP
jgi:hypothetical protein